MNKGRAVHLAARFSFGASRKRRVVLALLALMGVCALALLFAAATVVSIARSLPEVKSLADTRLSKTTTIVSSDGVVLATLETRSQRPVSLSDIAPALVDATIAVEDERFYQHGGVDSRGIMRALWSNLRLGRARGQGGSTLTQQLARNLYLSNEKTYRRKIAEMLLAQRMEQQFSKRDILEAYLNTVYYGGGNYGAEAAARSYFGKSAKTLTLGEAALLAGIPQRPSAYAPTLHLRAALERRQDVLARLEANGKITSEQHTRAMAEKPRILRPHPQSMAQWKAPYFVSDVIAQLRDQYGPEFVYSGVTVETTLNWQIQQAAEQTMREAVKQGNESSANPNTGALVSLDPHTGYVRALVGGPDFARDQFDAVTRGVRQPGSAFKPLLYAVAFDSKVCNLLSTYKDRPLTYPATPKDYVVHNFDEKYHGEADVLEAIRHSLNTVAVKVGEETGAANVVTYAQRMGIKTFLEPTLPLALGASGVHPIELCSAYTLFANGGERFEPAFITRIANARGLDVFQDDPAARHVAPFLKPRALDQINVALREVVMNGSGTAAAPIEDARGKTGTTNSHRDAWFVGYNADLATAIWVAHSRKEVKIEKNAGVVTQNTVTTYAPMEGATGGRLCAPLWTRFMQAALPVQRKANAARGFPSAPVTAPTVAALLETLKTEAKQAAQEKAAKREIAQAEEGTAAPAGFQPALNGSGPIRVTADADEQDAHSEAKDTGDSDASAKSDQDSGDNKDDKSGSGDAQSSPNDAGGGSKP